MSKNRRGSLTWFLLAGMAFGRLQPQPAQAFPQTQDLKGQVVDVDSKPLPGAVCTLRCPRTGVLPEEGLSVTADESGNFKFPGLLPGTYDLTCAAVGHVPVAKKGLEITAQGAPFLQMVLPAEVVVREKVEVREKAPTVSQQEAAPPQKLSFPQLRSLPLTEQKFKAALPLVPGVVRTPDGKINIKGSAENQGMLLVDSAETVDPITGSFSIQIPLDAVESVEVRKSAYQAEYGHFSGGLTSVRTKPPSDHWHLETNDFLPGVRIKGGHIVGISDDSPRVSFTGPLIANKLNFSESFIYDLNKQPVRGLAWPHNEIKKEGFDSFTSFQAILSPQQLLSVNVNVFPERREFEDINSLIPQSASSNYGQRGFSVGGTDRVLTSSGGALTTLVQYTRFSSYAYGQGPDDMLVTANGWGGNFFNAWSRAASQEEVFQTYQMPSKEAWGKHELKFGADYVRRSYTGTSRARPVIIQRPDQTVAERIDFTAPGQNLPLPGSASGFPEASTSLAASDTEVAGFAQDHWAFSDQFALDAGLRYFGQTLGDHSAAAPRLGMVYSPGSGGRTVIRSGIGVFFDRVPLLAGDFTDNLVRTVRYFDEQGRLVGQPVTFNDVYVKVDDRGRHVIPPGHHLSSTPYNKTWNIELDQELRPRVVLRLSYLSSRTHDEFIVDPQNLSGSEPVLLLTNTGSTRYHEFEATLRVRPNPNADWNLSYTDSLARGDLNTLSQVFVPFELPVIRPDYFADLPSNVPHRLITWGRFKVPWNVTVSPVIDYHSGFPYSSVDVHQAYVGRPDSLRFPRFFSLDAQFSKDFHLRLIPLLQRHTFRGALRVFNITNHSNPRDVYASVVSPYFGHFVGFQHRLYDVSLDVVY